MPYIEQSYERFSKKSTHLLILGSIFLEIEKFDTIAVQNCLEGYKTTKRSLKVSANFISLKDKSRGASTHAWVFDVFYLPRASLWWGNGGSIDALAVFWRAIGEIKTRTSTAFPNIVIIGISSCKHFSFSLLSSKLF